MRENIIEQLRFCATHFSCDGCGGKCSTSSNEPRTAFVLNDAADAIEELLSSDDARFGASAERSEADASD